VKKVVFLTGSMGSGKSSICAKATAKEKTGFIVKCKEFDILGTKQIGADSLSGYKKEDVMEWLKSYKGKLVIAGEYYSKQKDILFFENLGFDMYCILLKVSRETIYKRILSRGNGAWNELTYTTNLKNRIAFIKKFNGQKFILENETQQHLTDNFKLLASL
jgi:dephospho-CoA kinase